jgi:hypothetical protein
MYPDLQLIQAISKNDPEWSSTYSADNAKAGAKSKQDVEESQAAALSRQCQMCMKLFALAQTHGHSEGTTYFRVCILAANLHIFYTLNKRIDGFVELCWVSPFLHHQTNLICISATLWWTADMVANCYNKHNNIFKENLMCHKCYSITCYDGQKSHSTMYYVDAWIVHNLMRRKYNNGRVV